MEFSGRYHIAAAPQAVWDGLFDPAILKACIPGCEALEQSGASDFAARIGIKIGPMKASFQGKVTLREQEPPTRCVLAGEGQGGVAGFAQGEAIVLLAPAQGGTELSYSARANVGGKLAQIGQRLIDAAAHQLADQFFARFSQALAPPPPSAGAPGIRNRPDAPSPVIWMTGLAAVVIILGLMLMVVR